MPLQNRRSGRTDDKPSTKAQIDDWKKQNKKKAIKFLDTVKPEIVELAKSAGLDIEGYKHKVTDDFARHVIKKHGNKKEEAKRGQIAVTQEDLDNIKTVMNTPDIVVAGVKKNGKDRIVLVKNTEHGSILVEEVLSGRRNKTLNAKTFWIMDKTVDEAKIQKILTNTNGYDVSKIKVASLTGTNSVLSSSKDEGGSNSAVKTATTKGQPNNRTVHTSESIADKADSVNENKPSVVDRNPTINPSSVGGNGNISALPDGNSSIADKADSDKEDLPENASSRLDKGVAEIRKHYEGKYGLKFYASTEGEVYLSNDWSPNDLNESELRDCAKVLDSIKKEYDAIYDAPLDKAERFSSFLGSAHAEQLKDRVNARLDELEAKRAVLVFNKDMAASVDLTSLSTDVEETFHHSIKWANSVGIEWAEIARPVTRINELIKNSPEAKRFIQKLADIDENDNLEDLSDLYKEALYNHFAKAGLFLTKFSNLSDKQKDEKKKQIQSFPVASIEKDTVAYNGDGKFGNAAKEWLEQNPLGNASTEIGEVVINKAAVDKDLHHGAKENLYTKLQTLPAIKDVLEKGTYLGYEGNRTSNDKIDNHYFAGKIRYGDKEKIIFCRVKNAAGDKNRFYVHEVFTEDEIKKEASNTVADVDPSLLTGTPLYKFILQDVLNVKGDSEKDIKDTVKKAFDRFFAQWTA